MSLLTFHALGQHRDSPRLWLESRRLTALGFAIGTALTVAPLASGNGVALLPAPLGTHTVSHRTEGGRQRPVIDLNNRTLLAPLGGVPELRVTGTYGRLTIEPSVRGATILRRVQAPTLKVVELFCGGGTLTQAIGAPFEVVAGVELDPLYADCWQALHPGATLIQGDVRHVHQAELPGFDVLVAGVPCTSHSNMGRAKKSLAGKPELGDTGDLFLSVLNLVAAHLPAAVVLENVPNFGDSLAGQCLTGYLAKLGYHVTATVVRPHAEWGEPCDRQRWLCVATLKPGFQLSVPGTPFAGTLAEYLDAPDPAQDADDAARIAGTIAGLRAHNARHAALGHGFAFTEITGTDTKCPVIAKSYHKINTGPFVSTPHGPRLLRLPEIERLHGAHSETDHYATAVQVLGQGVLTRVFRPVFTQLAQHLTA